MPKGLIQFNNQSLLRRTAELLRPYCEKVVLLGNPRGYEEFGLQSLADSYPKAGPLAGLAAALDATSKDVLLVPCDLPLLTASILSELLVESGHFQRVTLTRSTL